ncbi:anthranilate synthase component II [Francisella tularensis]|uniref:anthranilate synthase component II n=1 Tax=Francisella tularensis TaxID=263 RepID=UPI0000F59253|nr:aminodeoxychorismate/anthranilate synthase component II [Francisella tularensis]ABO46705.1 glutamine amidotransferase of anthranilate synthase or para-aminobenzoate synthase [Francisella tularensis subsp. tularensis WY96-3418]AJI62964.1 glutamine amidotransferase of anthranilate synthase/aminodeoxychorismate synthase family protein [Francisella tularensis subsp. tularensis]AKH91956.1 anthranilate synthase subunit II [Francisella tularensis subsp. tularensis WY-00W4114]AKU73733.1 glutamine am
MVLYIDHYDSFSSTIVDYITYLGYQVSMLKTDEQIDNIDQYSHIIIGPGPGHPDELKNIYPIIEYCQQKKLPLLGICLGHQLIAQYYGAKIIKAKQIYHGKLSEIKQLQSSALYKDHPVKFAVTRYHSLIVNDIKEPLITLAATDNHEIMAFAHQNAKIFGVQYHPEAYLTEYGLATLKNFLSI